MIAAVPADRRDVGFDEAFAGEQSVREQAAAIARKTDSAPPGTLCPWCPDFVPDPVFSGVSHGLCEPCAARLNADLDRREASR
jgi:hypothetical protein